MRIRIPIVLAAAFLWNAALAVAQDTTYVKKPMSAEPAAAAPSAPAAAAAPSAASAATLGHPDSVKWSATTYEAASAEANKEVLRSGHVAKVTGEVVDVSCYLQLGKRGDAHVACGTKCLTNGQPIGLLDSDGNLYIVMAEQHHPRRDGQADLKSVFIPLLAKTVTVNGMEVDMRGYRALFVNSTDLRGMAKPAAKPAK